MICPLCTSAQSCMCLRVRLHCIMAISIGTIIHCVSSTFTNMSSTFHLPAIFSHLILTKHLLYVSYCLRYEEAELDLVLIHLLIVPLLDINFSDYGAPIFQIMWTASHLCWDLPFHLFPFTHSISSSWNIFPLHLLKVSSLHPVIVLNLI